VFGNVDLAPPVKNAAIDDSIAIDHFQRQLAERIPAGLGLVAN
jgi:hypothetical protein